MGTQKKEVVKIVINMKFHKKISKEATHARQYSKERKNVLCDCRYR